MTAAADALAGGTPIMLAASRLRLARFRHQAAAACTGGFALVLLAHEVIATGRLDTAEQIWRAATEQSGRPIADAALLFLASAMLIVAAATIVRMVPRRGGLLALIGGTFLVLGALGRVAVGTYVLLVATMAAEGANPAQAIAVLDRVAESPSMLLIFPLVMSYGLGVLFAFIALRRARIVPGWLLAAVVIVVLVAVLPLPVLRDQLAFHLVTHGTVAAAFGYLALQIARSPSIDALAFDALIRKESTAARAANMPTPGT